MLTRVKINTYASIPQMVKCYKIKLYNYARNINNEMFYAK